VNGSSGYVLSMTDLGRFSYVVRGGGVAGKVGVL